MIRVAIIGDRPETRSQLKAYLEQDPCNMFRKVDAYNSIDTFMSDAYMHTQLDVIVLDMALSIGIPPLEGISIIKKTCQIRHAKLLFLTSIVDHSYSIFKLLCHNGGSYIAKEMSPAKIMDAVIALHTKGGLMSKPLGVKLKSELTYGQIDKGIHQISLSKMEKNIIREVVINRRMGQEAISKELNIREDLIRRYIRNTFIKLLDYSIARLPAEQELPVHKPTLIFESYSHKVDYRNAV
jgi:DNA-binding NarL/FixJ family response regulator